MWKWWEEEKKEDGVKWTYLEHKGPVFAPDYEPMPKDVRFYYDGKLHMPRNTILSSLPIFFLGIFKNHDNSSSLIWHSC